MLFLTLALASTGDTGLLDTAVVDLAPPPAYPRPVGYWPLDEADTVVPDLAHHHEGLLVGTLDTDGPAGPAQAFGPGAFADLGDHLSRMTSGDDARFALAAWVRPDVAAPGVLWSKGSHPSVCAATTPAAELMVRIDHQGRVVAELFGAGGGLLRIRSHDRLPLNAWSHLVVVHDSAVTAPADRVVLYLDGLPWSADLLVANGGNFPIADTDAPLALGAQLDTDGFPCSSPPFQGAIDEAAVFNVALRDDQVAALHERSAWGASLLADDDPMELLFLLDRSCSMATGTPISGMAGTDLALEAAAVYLAEHHGPADMVSAYQFSEGVIPWTYPFVIADDPDALLAQWSAFDSFSVLGATNHSAAFHIARDVLSERADLGMFQAIVLITHGNPTVGADTLADEIDATRAAGIHVWTLGFGSSINMVAMNEYKQGFGTFELTPNSTGLAAILTSILESTP